MRRGEAIAVRFTLIGEQAMRAPSESDTSMERGTSTWKELERKHLDPEAIRRG